MANFTPRTTAPTTDNAYYYANNPFYISGYGMPNCTCYAWGRFYEISGTRPTLSTGDAEKWYIYTNDGYKRGTTPKLGAIICWSCGSTSDDSDGGGHVAVVEAINSDGTIVTSESGWNSDLWWTTTRNNSGGNWGASSKYTFQGFIYNPAVTNENSGGATRYNWIAGNYYLTKAEQQNNAIIIYNYFTAKGWTRNAIAGMLGNMERESTVNPGCWEGLTNSPEAFKNKYGYYPGFGLVQWTPYTRYVNWAGEGSTTGNWNKQLERLQWEMENKNSDTWYATANYPESFEEFTKSTKSAYYLAGAFLYNYERPAAQYADPVERGNMATAWFDFLETAPIITGGNLPVWLLFKLKEWRK